MINSCKNNCLLISHFLPFHSCLSKSLFQFSSHTETLILVAVYSLRQFSSFNYSVHFFPCAHFQLDVPQKLLKIHEPELVRANVCQNVCMCVYLIHQTRSALVLYFILPESFTERTFPAVSAESRLDVWCYSICVPVCTFINMSVISIVYEVYHGCCFFRKLLMTEISLQRHSLNVLFSIVSRVSR